ncbi:ankyrin repeat-containing domain protein [Usnea florida]
MPAQRRPVILSTEIPSDDLWSKALDTLDPELRNSLVLTHASRSHVLSKALTEAQESKKVCMQKRWKYKKSNGEIIILRDVVEKIIVWVEKFIAVGNAAIQYDPVHAAPAWAAFRFVLQAAVNDKTVLGEAIANLEAVSHIITRYAILEELYLQGKPAARDQFEDTVVRLYAEVLTYLAKAKEYFQSSTKSRLAKSVVKIFEGEQMAKINVLDGQLSRLTELFTIDEHLKTAREVSAMNALLVSLKEPIKRLADDSSTSTKTFDESQHLQLLKWLSPVPFSSHHKRHFESRIPGSGQWLLNHDRYLHWSKSSTSSIFLLHGIMGSGKTSLASTVIAETERSNPDEIMRSILRQLTITNGPSPTIQERILIEYERRQAMAKLDGFEVTRLQAAECVSLILDTTAANPATIVVDAVDEIPSSSRHILLSALAQVVQESLSVVKVLVTSRDDSNIHALLTDAVAVRVQNEHTRKDMEDFVHQEVSSAIQDRRMLNGTVSADLQKELESVLVAGAREMFVWVVRQIKNLCRMKTEADIKNAMRVLPRNTLNELYEEDFAQMSQIGHHSQGYATQVFSMLLCTQEALSPEALIQALAKTISRQEEAMDVSKLIDICSSLVVLDSELNVLRFAHISFQEFLETLAEFTSPNVHRVAAACCLDSCLQGLPSEMEADLWPKDNFDHYSAVYWAEHCRVANLSGDDELIRRKMREFVFDGRDIALSFVDWIQAVRKFAKRLPNDHAMAKWLHSVTNSHDSPLFTACVFGLAPVIEELTNSTEYDWSQTNDHGQSGLYLAAVAGHTTTVKHLLQHEVFVNAFGGKFDYPLHAACFSGHVSIVNLLLEHGADPKLGIRSALEYALLGDHENIALLLLKSKFDVSDQSEYEFVVQQAAEAGFSEVVQSLQKEYASLYGDFGSSRRRAVDLAIFKGRTRLIERHMQKLSDPRSEMPKDAIATAALGGQDAMISLLIGQGLDLNEEGKFGTPLRSASIMRHESTVRLLLRLGANLHVIGSFGGPLQAAAMRGHEAITRDLLSHGADVNSKGGLYGTALQAAAHRGHQKIVGILLDAGADVHGDGFSRDALHAASEGGQEHIIRFLLERGFKFRDNPVERSASSASPCTARLRETKPPWGNQPEPEDWHERASLTDPSQAIEKLRGAASCELDLIQLHRERHEHRYKDEKNYALSAAAGNGYAAVVELLLNELDERDTAEEIGAALVEACKNSHVVVVELLLEHLDTIDVSKDEIGAALVQACKNGQITIVELLLNQPDTMDISSKIDAAFIEACANGQEEVISLLLSYGLKAEVMRAALSAATSEGHITVVNLLMGHEDKLRLARAETVGVISPATRNSRTQEVYEYDSAARTILVSGCEEDDLLVFKPGQDSVAQRSTAAAPRYIYGAALTTAAAHGQFDILKLLLERNFEFGFEDLTKSLKSICGWGNEDALKALLDYDAKKVLGIQQYSSGLNEAALKNNSRIVLYWLEEHPEHHNLVVDPTTVISVSGNGFVEVLSPLLKAIKSADSRETTLNQALQVASTMGYQEVVKCLVNEGADVNASVEEARRSRRYGWYKRTRSTRKVSALQAALIGFERFAPENHYKHAQSLKSGWQGADASSQQQCIEILLASGADPNRTDGYERHPLSIAATYGTVETVEILISSGAHVETSTKEHGTALQAAAGRVFGSLPIVKILLDASVSESPVDSGRLAALDEALSCLWRHKAHNKDNPNSIRGMFSTGPGAVVRILLANLPEQKTDDVRYGLVAQMACIIGDQKWVELLIQRGLDLNISAKANAYTLHYGTMLQAASSVGNINIVECLFKAGADVNIVHGVHSTALRAAVLGGHEDLVGILIARGADVNLRSKDEDDSVLHLALKSGNPTILKALLAAGAETNIKPFDEEHILITACKIGDAALVETLLGSGVNVNVSEARSGRRSKIVTEEATPLNAACSGGHLSVVRLLLDYGADVERTSDSSATPLMVAVRGNHLLVVRLLLEVGANIYHATYAAPPSEATKEGRLALNEESSSMGAITDFPSIKNNALAEAGGSRPRMIAELLLEALSGTRHEEQVCSETFRAAMRRGDDDLACLLLEHGMPLSFQMLRQSCGAGTLQTVKMLVDNDVNIDQDDGIDAPLIHVAASHSNPDIVKFLIDRGANVMLRSAKYGSPLIAALEGTMAPFLRSWSQSESCRSLAEQLPFHLLRHWAKHVSGPRSNKKPGYKEISQSEQILLSLFDAGAEIDMTIRSFGNALHLASYMGSEVIVRHLLKSMKTVNMFGGYFESPLIAGVKGNNIRIVELLLNRDVDINRASPEHGSALHAACAQGSKKMVQTLLDHGADVNAYDDKIGSVLATAASPPGKHALFSKGRRTIVELLLHQEPKVQIRGSDILAAASWMSDYFGMDFTDNFLDALFENGRTVDFTSKTREDLDKLFDKTPRWQYVRTSVEKMREKFYRLEKRHK